MDTGSDRSSGVMHTMGNIAVDLANFTPDMVNLKDIAHALQNIMRFNGHTEKPFSVLQHSLIGARLAETPAHKLEALLHDAGEAYTGDIILPMKEVFPDLSTFEDKITGTIFDVLFPNSGLVRNGSYIKSPYMSQLDKRMAKWESYYLRPTHEFEQDTHDTIQTWLVEHLNVKHNIYEYGAVSQFMYTYNTLSRELWING